MIKDIGTEGLKAGTVTFVSADKVKRGDDYENTYEFDIRLTESESIGLDVVDVTTVADTERKYMQVGLIPECT